MSRPHGGAERDWGQGRDRRPAAVGRCDRGLEFGGQGQDHADTNPGALEPLLLRGGALHLDLPPPGLLVPAPPARVPIPLLEDLWVRLGPPPRCPGCSVTYSI